MLNWSCFFMSGGVLPDPFRGMGVRKNSTETQQSDHAPRSGLDVKNGRSSVAGKSSAGEDQMRDNSEGGELDPAGDARRCCKKNSVFSSARRSFYPAQVRG